MGETTSESLQLCRFLNTGLSVKLTRRNNDAQPYTYRNVRLAQKNFSREGVYLSGFRRDFIDDRSLIDSRNILSLSVSLVANILAAGRLLGWRNNFFIIGSTGTR
jgi:hypothetical protein